MKNKMEWSSSCRSSQKINQRWKKCTDAMPPKTSIDVTSPQLAKKKKRERTAPCGIL
jgi:hypothetical protein